jgi:hypothetical protein
MAGVVVRCGAVGVMMSRRQVARLRTWIVSRDWSWLEMLRAQYWSSCLPSLSRIMHRDTCSSWAMVERVYV